jgi:hypothetical protein
VSAREGPGAPPPPWSSSLATGKELETSGSTPDRVLVDPRRPPPHVPSDGMAAAVGVARSVVAAVVCSPGGRTVVVESILVVLRRRLHDLLLVL